MAEAPDPKSAETLPAPPSADAGAGDGRGGENGGAIEYNPAAYPYFFGADGKSYATWTPRLLRAAFNYQYSQKAQGVYVHNPKYIIQILIDSIEDLGGTVTTYTRPEVPAPAQ